MLYRRHPTAAYTEVEGEVFIVTSDNRLHNLRGSSALTLWQLLADGPSDIDGLARELTRRFDVEWDRARQDVKSFVDRSVERGVLVAAADEVPAGAASGTGAGVDPPLDH